MAAALASCSTKESPGPGGASECSYKVTIDGETTLPNRFGQDKIVITTSMAAESSADEGFGIRIAQAKKNTKNEAVLDAIVHGHSFSTKLAEGTYPVEFFGATSFATPGSSLFPLYGFDRNDGHNKGDLTITVVENSGQRIRMKVSGKVMKQIEVGDGAQEAGLVPVEAEITVGRKYYVETGINGALAGGGVCDCREQ